MKCRAPAADSTRGWGHESLPPGNGCMGVNATGIVSGN